MSSLLWAAGSVTIINKSNTNYWIVGLTALIASVAGAAVASWSAAVLSKKQSARLVEAERRAFLRPARAEIYRGVLHEVNDHVANTVRAMRGSQEPQAQDPWLGLRFSDLYRDATAASGEDGAMVFPFQAQWDGVGAVNARFAQERTRDDVDVLALTRVAYQDQLIFWENAQAILNRYNEFLKNYLEQPLPGP